MSIICRYSAIKTQRAYTNEKVLFHCKIETCIMKQVTYFI